MTNQPCHAPPPRLTRRGLLAAGAALPVASGLIPGTSWAQTAPGSFDISTIERPPLTDRQAFIEHMVARGRGEEADILGWRFDRMQRLVGSGDLWREKEIGAFLLAPREIFALDRNRSRAYDHAYLDIGYGVTISGPHIVGRMTSGLDLQPGQKVLEIRHRVRLPGVNSRLPDPGSVLRGGHRPAGGADPRHLRPARLAAHSRNSATSARARRTVTTAGKNTRRSMPSSSLPPSTTSRRPCCSNWPKAAPW